MLSVMLALVSNLATNTVQVKEPWWPYTVWAVAGLLFICSLVKETRARRIAPEAPSIDKVKESLVLQERDHRLRDIDRTELRRPVPLRVRWSSTARPVAASRRVVLNTTADLAWRDAPLTGHIGEIVKEFRRLPSRQLVILGPAGAGKSSIAALLDLGLLERRQEAVGLGAEKVTASLDRNHPIPVYVSIASWDPENEHIESFIVRQMNEQFEFPTNTLEFGTCYADALMKQGCLVPVLDGLDELPSELLTSAIEGLEAFTAAERPFVLTCRVAEYEQAVANSGLLLSRAAVVEIEPVDVDAAITFIAESDPTGERWASVFKHLRRSPDSSLAQVLSTPLMVSLARLAYRAPDTDPRDLLNKPDYTSIAALLLDRYIDSVYPRRPRPGHTGRQYDGVKVTKWLTFLAHHLYQSGKRSLQWWQLSPVLLPKLLQRQVFLLAIATLLVLVATGAAGSLFLEVRQSAALALTSAAIFGVGTSGIFSELWCVPRSELARRARGSMLFGGFVGALGGFLAAQPFAGLLGGALCGLHVALVPHWTARAFERRMREPLIGRSRAARSITVSRWNALVAAVQYGAVGTASFAFAGCAVFDVGNPLTTTVAGGAVCALIAAYCAGLGTLSRFRLTSVTLAIAGRLPWRLVTFLDDARVRGALRVAGDSWQFRHAVLQDHLSDKVQPANLWVRIENGRTSAVNRLADLYAGNGQIGELYAISNTGNSYATFRLIDALESIGQVDKAIELTYSRAGNGWKAKARLADLLADHGRIDALRRLADTGNSHAITRLAMVLASSADIDEVVRLTRVQLKVNGWQASEPLLDLLSHHGQVDTILDLTKGHISTRSSYDWLIGCFAKHGRLDELRTLTHQGRMWAADPMLDELLDVGRAEEAIAIARKQAAAGAWISTKRLIKVLVSAGRLDEAIDTARTLARTGNKLANELYLELLVKQGATGVIEELARSGDMIALGQHACHLAEQGRVVEAMSLVRNRAGQLELSDVLTTMGLVAKHGHVDELRFLTTSSNTQVSIHLMKLLAVAGDGDGVADIASRYFDTRDLLAVGQVVGALAEVDRADDALRLAQRHDHGRLGTFTIRLVHQLVAHDRPDRAIAVLRGFAESGSAYGMDWLIELLAATDRMDEAIRLAEETPNPKNDRWRAVIDHLIGLLNKEGRIEEAIAIARLRAGGTHNASWARLRTASG